MSPKPATSANHACFAIYKQLLTVIQDNEQNVMAASDTQSLHNFRVAVRKTRSGLSQFKGVLPDEVQRHYADFFAWLGTATSPRRDLDVYLEDFSHYQRDLPAAIQAHLQPLRDLLLRKQQHAHRDLVAALQSPRYTQTLAKWQDYLNTQVAHAPASGSIQTLARQRLRKNYQKVLRQAQTISEYSPDTALHTLRKSCKKLRYLIEFFQALYDKDALKSLLKKLKDLQIVLGQFQDSAVQEQQLKHYQSELAVQQASVDTLSALAVFIARVDARKYQARREFTAVFRAFQQAKPPSF